MDTDRHETVDDAVTGVCRRLAREYAGTFSIETVERYVSDSRHRWAGALITMHLP